jgi:succinate dehydrogenase / fumarate reductase cytochrome b subunit
MALSLTKENYVLHRIHSITGVIPVGYYMVQHLALNSFSIGGEAKFNGVIDFFEGIPKHVLLAMEVLAIWLPLIFHAVYGVFIVSRAENNFFTTKYKWSHNRMFFLQRASGLVIFAFLIYHSLSTTGYKYATGDVERLKFAAWHEFFSNPLWVLVYATGIIASSYHLGYGIWNFCIRWGITVSEEAQTRIQKASALIFVALTLLGWGVIAGFIINKPGAAKTEAATAALVQPLSVATR